jgi:hypothetical protein
MTHEGSTATVLRPAKETNNLSYESLSVCTCVKTGLNTCLASQNGNEHTDLGSYQDLDFNLGDQVLLSTALITSGHLVFTCIYCVLFLQ